MRVSQSGSVYIRLTFEDTDGLLHSLQCCGCHAPLGTETRFYLQPLTQSLRYEKCLVKVEQNPTCTASSRACFSSCLLWRSSCNSLSLCSYSFNFDRTSWRLFWASRVFMKAISFTFNENGKRVRIKLILKRERKVCVCCSCPRTIWGWSHRRISHMMGCR